MIGRTELDLTRLETEETLQMSLSLRGEESGAQPVCDLSLVLWVTGINGPGNSGEPGTLRKNRGSRGRTTLDTSLSESSRLQGSALQGFKVEAFLKMMIRMRLIIFFQEPPTLSVSWNVRIISSGRTQK